MRDSLVDTILQIFAIWINWVVLFALFPIIFICILFPPALIVVIPYFIYMRVDDIASRGGRFFPSARKWWIWKYYVAYFPSQLIVEEHFNPTKTYIFGLHPHGVLSFSFWLNLNTDAAGASEKMGGLDYRILTLPHNFKTPIWRDWIMALGFANVTRESCSYMLKHGLSIMLVPGGLEECLLVTRTSHKIILRKRKGIFRLALEQGSSLVPVFSFGENQMYSMLPAPRGSTVRKIYDLAIKLIGAPPLVVWGRGYAPLPYQIPVATVVGPSIPVEKKPNYTDEDIAELQEKYIEQLTALYNRHVDKYTPGIKLEIVE